MFEPFVPDAVQEIAPILRLDRPGGNDRVGSAGFAAIGARYGEAFLRPVPRGHRVKVLAFHGGEKLDQTRPDLIPQEPVNIDWASGIVAIDHAQG